MRHTVDRSMPAVHQAERLLGILANRGNEEHIHEAFAEMDVGYAAAVAGHMVNAAVSGMDAACYPGTVGRSSVLHLLELMAHAAQDEIEQGDA